MEERGSIDRGGIVDFRVAVGTEETHDVHLHFNQWFGQVRIDVDGEDTAGDWRVFTFHKTRRYEFPVGREERHDVVVEKSRKGILGGFGIRPVASWSTVSRSPPTWVR